MATASNAARTARRAAMDAGTDLSHFRKRLDKALARTGKNARRGVVATDKYVHKHPWTAVGVAAGTMVLAGLALAAAVSRPRSARAQISDGFEDLARAVSLRVQKLRR